MGEQIAKDDSRLSFRDLKVGEVANAPPDQDRAFEVAPGVYVSRGVGSSYLITTAGDSILVNAGTLGDARQGVSRFQAVSKKPIRYIVLTQSHANQYGGLEVYKTPENHVIAHQIYRDDRRYSEALSAHYRRGSSRIFGTITDSAQDIAPTKEVMPDVWIEGDYRLELGGRRFEIFWTPGGEARCAVAVWMPAERIAVVGNLLGPRFGNQPNLNTLRGGKARSAVEFVDSVRRIRDLGPDLLLTGHEVIEGGEHIYAEMGRIADSVQWVHDQTIEGMNRGADLWSLMHEIKPPQELALAEEYGKVSWNVRSIWHEYNGWFDPSRGTTELYGIPPSSVSPALLELSGGAERICLKASEYITQNQPVQALHLLEIVGHATPDHPKYRTAMRAALTALLKQVGSRNLWESMWIQSQLRALS